MQKNNLLSCPFCGRKPKSRELNIQLYQISCLFSKCPAHPCVIKKTPEEAAEAWNTRAPGWIPCSERLPDDDSYKWAVGITSSGRCIAFQEHNAYENDTGGISVPTYLAHGSEISHWMPLPETPKEVQHDKK